MTTLEVRCCCRPTKLLGWVDVPERLAHIGRHLVVNRRTIEPVRPAWDRVDTTPVPVGRRPPARLEQFVFPVDGYIARVGDRPYPAVKSEERSVKDLQELLAPYSFRLNDPQLEKSMHFTISASGTKEQVLEQLEKQREPSPDYASLKNQVLEHVAGYVQAADGVTSVSVSISASVNLTQSSTPAASSEDLG